MKRGTDVIVVGGGAIGLTTAWELASQGLTVRVVDKGRCGREASWAGAGMIIPGNSLKAETPEARLRAASFELWEELSARLLDETGIDNGFQSCGALELETNTAVDRLAREVSDWRREGVDAVLLDTDQLRKLEPAIGGQVRGGYELPSMSQIRNPRHLRALQHACERRGVRFSEECEVQSISLSGSRVTGVRTEQNRFTAEHVCVCAGAWTSTLLQNTDFSFKVEPVRGQMVMLRACPLPFQRILQQGSRYVVPRSDGRALVGSTEEWVGFEKRTTAAAVADLIHFGVSLVPELGEATVERTWSGLRPGSPEGVPFLGRVPNAENLYVAAGHFRNGLQNSPASGRLLRQMILGQNTCLNPADFCGGRRTDVVAAS